MRPTTCLPVIAALVGIVALGCEKHHDTAASTSAPVASPDPLPARVGGATENVGVPECDDYLSKYEACVRDKVPEASQAAMAKNLVQLRAAWKQAARTEAGKQRLATACETALETAKQAMTSYDCEW
jgi:hypothetical protein